MFLIKSSLGRVFLHTGDFRFSPSMVCERSVLSSVWIDVLYFDATFCHPTHRFPTKTESARAFAEFIRSKRSDAQKRWRRKQRLDALGTIFVSAQMLGVETFLAELCRSFSAFLWVDPRSWKHRHFALFEETAPFLTSDASKAMFHVPNDFAGSWRAEKQKSV